MPKSMYDIIKKQNGEHFAKAIRNYDNGIFDIQDLDKIVKYAGRDAEPIMNYLVSLKNIQIKEMSVHRDPIDLLNMAGYHAYVADTLEKQNAIKKYFAPGEELCTFRDPHRFEKYYIINAVRKDVDKIKRSPTPEREDTYGTSVISIQILKSGGFISIKNRYNHTVQQPDNTLWSNPDNIILGLSDAIKHYFNVNFSASRVELPNGYTLQNNQIFKYNQEIDNIYFGPDFYVKDGMVHELDKDKEIMIGNGLVLNLSTKAVKCIPGFLDVGFEPRDLEQSIEEIIKDKKIRLDKGKDGKKSLFANDVHVLDVFDGMITWVNAPNAKTLVLRNTKLDGDLDFSHVENIDLSEADLSTCTSVKFNPNAKLVYIKGSKTVYGGDMDFSNVKTLILPLSVDGDFSNVTGFKLPKTFLLHTLDVFNVNKIKGILDLSNINIVNLGASDLSNVELVFGQNHRIVQFRNIKGLHGVLDMENIPEVYLSNLDLSQVYDLKISSSANTVRISETTGLSGDFDFSRVQFLNLETLDFSNVKNIKFGQNQNVTLIYCKNLHGNIDLSHAMGDVRIWNTDFSNVTSLKLPKSLNDTLSGIIAPHGIFDVSHIDSKQLNFNHSDLSRITDLRIPANLNELKFIDTKMPATDLSFTSNIDWLNCMRTDFSRVKKFVLSGKVDNLNLQKAIGLHGDLDFSNVTKLDLTDADLSRVKSIKFNPNGVIIGLKPRDKIRFALINATQKIKQTFTKTNEPKVSPNDTRSM